MITPDNASGILLEYVTIGSSTKVTALDQATLIEASVVVPHGTSEQDAAQLAVRKLKYRLRRQKES